MQTATLARNAALPPPAHLAGLHRHGLDPLVPRMRAPGMPARMTVEYQGGQSVRQLQKSWTGVSANLAEMHCDGSLQVDIGAACPRLSVVLEEVGGRFVVEPNGCCGQRASYESPQ